MTLLLAIPVVNLVMLIVWAVDRENETRRNCAIAVFIWIAIGIVLALFVAGLFGFAFAAMPHAAPLAGPMRVPRFSGSSERI